MWCFLSPSLGNFVNIHTVVVVQMFSFSAAVNIFQSGEGSETFVVSAQRVGRILNALPLLLRLDKVILEAWEFREIFLKPLYHKKQSEQLLYDNELKLNCNFTPSKFSQ